MMNVSTGQVWEDCDSRRRGRIFKIVNIDDEAATCENLSGAKQGQTSFINLKRFIPKYYKLKDNGIRTFSTLDEHESAPVQRMFDTITVVRRAPKASLVQECKNLWPAEWREIGPFISLTSKHGDFEVLIRQIDEFNKPFETKVKLYNFTIYSFTARDIEDSIKKTQDFFLMLNLELQNIIVGEI